MYNFHSHLMALPRWQYCVTIDTYPYQLTMLEHPESTPPDSPNHQESASKDTIVDQLTNIYREQIPISYFETPNAYDVSFAQFFPPEELAAYLEFQERINPQNKTNIATAPEVHFEKYPSRACFKTDPASIKSIISQLSPKYPSLTDLDSIIKKLEEISTSENMDLILNENGDAPERLLVVIRAKKNIQYQSKQMSEYNMNFFQDLIYAILSANAL